MNIFRGTYSEGQVSLHIPKDRKKEPGNDTEASQKWRQNSQVERRQVERGEIWQAREMINTCPNNSFK